MNTLIVEDDYITSQVMQELMLAFGNCDIAENGKIALDLFESGLETGKPYDVIFLDIMMPEMDGQETLAVIRDIEKSRGILGLDGVKIVMTTALDDFSNVRSAFRNQAEGYIVKPIDKDKIVKILAELHLID
ncbi:MAG: response regulator [Chloroflexota bacterium]